MGSFCEVFGGVEVFDAPHNHELLVQLKEECRISTREGDFEMWEYSEEKQKYYFPRFVGKSGKVYSKLSSFPPKQFRTGFSPREGQQAVVARALGFLQRDGHALIVAACGAGKTIMGSEVGLQLGQPICVLIHKEFLAAQWEEAFRLLCPEVTIGRLQRDRCDTGKTHDVVLAMTQSITNPRRDYPKEFYESFGLIISDEVHRYAADVWQTSMLKFPAKYRLSLTATDYRHDGLWPVISAHFGDNKVCLSAPSLVPLIYRVATSATTRFDFDKMPWFGDVQKRAKVITELAENESRNEVIARNIKRAFDAGRKVMVISERKSQLNWFGDRLRAYGSEDFGFYVGGKKMDALNLAAEKSVVLTTYQMAKEGLNIPDLDVLIMATPQAHIQQTVGRILRVFEGKGRPIVLDFVDEEIPMLKGMWFSRKREYSSFGYELA